MFIFGAVLPLVCVSVDSYRLPANGVITINDFGCYTVENDSSLTQAAGDARVGAINSPYAAGGFTPQGYMVATDLIATGKINTFQVSPYQSIGGKAVFIPTKTQAEWLSFVNHTPPGIIRYSCCAKTCI